MKTLKEALFSKKNINKRSFNDLEKYFEDIQINDSYLNEIIYTLNKYKQYNAFITYSHPNICISNDELTNIMKKYNVLYTPTNKIDIEKDFKENLNFLLLRIHKNNFDKKLYLISIVMYRDWQYGVRTNLIFKDNEVLETDTYRDIDEAIEKVSEKLNSIK